MESDLQLEPDSRRPFCRINPQLFSQHYVLTQPLIFPRQIQFDLTFHVVGMKPKGRLNPSIKLTGPRFVLRKLSGHGFQGAGAPRNFKT